MIRPGAANTQKKKKPIQFVLIRYCSN